MENIKINTRNGVQIIADEVEISGKKAKLKIRVAHKNPGEPLNKTTSEKIANEIAEWLISRESQYATILKAKS